MFVKRWGSLSECLALSAFSSKWVRGVNHSPPNRSCLANSPTSRDELTDGYVLLPLQSLHKYVGSPYLLTLAYVNIMIVFFFRFVSSINPLSISVYIFGIKLQSVCFLGAVKLSHNEEPFLSELLMWKQFQQSVEILLYWFFL
jgi:hypothetical protein